MNIRAIPLLIFFSLYLSSLMGQLDEGLVAYYHFDNGAAENQLDFYSNGQIKGQPQLIEGIAGGALYFNGNTDAIAFGGMINDYLSADREFSLSFYFRSGDLKQTRSLMGKRSQCNSFHHFDIQVGSRLTAELSERKNPNIRCRVAVEIPDQQWHHYIIIREQAGLRLYMDGQLVMVRYAAYPIYIEDEVPFAINASPCKGPGKLGHLIGAIDELSIYQYALFTEEIQSLHASLYQAQRKANATRPRQQPQKDNKLNKIFGIYQSSDADNQAQLRLDPKGFILTIKQPESYPETNQLTLRGKYKIEAGQLLLERGQLELLGEGATKERIYEGPKIIGDIYGEKITIDLLAFETRLKMVKRAQ